MMNNRPYISIIFPAKNEGDNVKTTLDSLFSVQTSFPFEVIVINDGSTDQCCDFLKIQKNNNISLIEADGVGVANARNLGAQNAVGEYLFFCDAHLEFEDWWIDRLLEPLLANKTDAVAPAIASFEKPNFIGYGQTLKFNLRIKWNEQQSDLFETAILPGGCFAISKEVFDNVGGFETGFRTWGHDDIELSIKLWLFGYRCHCQPQVKILHLFRKAHPYKVSYNDVYYNLLRMAYSHFTQERIQKCKKLILHGKAEQIESEVIRDGVTKQRRKYFKERKRNDDWYFHKFGINF
ncbi:glycosyltransferase family 2 protein [Mesobacillus maritimus]|uniref:glycosyltransferase family 2 protein n=1 Tax=Mesobacillus maritimus TaxID=1643336 RepID=UPI00384BEE9B